MPTPTEIMATVASLQNDTKRSRYTDSACLPYLNMALVSLQEQFELNDIPVTHETPAVLTVPVGTTRVAFTGTTPTLPSTLIEIKQLWESISGQDLWSPMIKKSYIPHYTEGVQVASFVIWAWENNEIKLPNSLQINDLKLDCIQSIFPKVAIADVETDLGTQFKNCESYLYFKTAAYCAMFIGENETRAEALNGEANTALSASMGISTKGRQSITFRRRPFRYSYHMRRRLG